MVSFAQLTLESRSPIYLQIVMYIKRGVIAGSIVDGDELPSRRMLSALLGVNPNTVQKAYHLLEDAQLISSRPGAGSCMSLDAQRIACIREELMREDARTLVLAMKQMGLERAQAKELIDLYWDRISEETE
ncbi:MAG: GntR family transcriptional regulator [Clostridia bacterium]|nr:GntR family transcriptional regulator [Clostridia bacterium]